MSVTKIVLDKEEKPSLDGGQSYTRAVLTERERERESIYSIFHNIWFVITLFGGIKKTNNL